MSKNGSILVSGKVLALMNDGSFMLYDKQGNKISFDPTGRLNTIRAKVIKGFSQGDYEVKFAYEAKDAIPQIREAQVIDKNKTNTIFSANYSYGQDGRLCQVIAPNGQKLDITYDDERVMMAMR